MSEELKHAILIAVAVIIGLYIVCHSIDIHNCLDKSDCKIKNHLIIER